MSEASHSPTKQRGYETFTLSVRKQDKQTFWRYCAMYDLGAAVCFQEAMIALITRETSRASGPTKMETRPMATTKSSTQKQPSTKHTPVQVTTTLTLPKDLKMEFDALCDERRQTPVQCLGTLLDVYAAYKKNAASASTAQEEDGECLECMMHRVVYGVLEDMFRSLTEAAQQQAQKYEDSRPKKKTVTDVPAHGPASHQVVQ